MAGLVRVGRQFQRGQVAMFADPKPGTVPVQGLALLAYKKRPAGLFHPRAFDKPRLDRARLVGAQRVR